MPKTLRQILATPDLRKKILIVLLLLLLARFLASIPMPGVDAEQLKNFFSNNQVFGLLNMFSGGAMQRFSLIMMGVGPYITASIIFQLLGMVIPGLEALSKEGERGQHQINQYTRYATVPLAILEAFGMIALLKKQGIIVNLDSMQLATMISAVTAGTLFLMFIGEIISENGLGNGISLLIALGIIAGFPVQIRNTAAAIGTEKTFGIILFLVLTIGVIGLIVLMNEGVRQIPVSYARRVRSSRMYGSVDTHLPLRVNTAGVVPIIFALSIMLFPGMIANFLTLARSQWLADGALKVANFFTNTTYYGIVYFVLTIVFTFFYTDIIFKPKDVAENLQKQGGFIPGIRPGKETSGFLSKVMYRITPAGAIFLGVIAVLPFIVQAITGINTIVLGGTGLLIVVSVIIETMRQIQAQVVMRSYDSY